MDFFDFCIGSHHGERAPEKSGAQHRASCKHLECGVHGALTIDIPVVRLGANSQKAALGVHLKELADYIDRQRDKATREQDQLMGRAA
ncbi:hypothetical protein CCL16_17285 [Pseudomonas syringae]|nr:hypothetical protein CCL16_17285 [Pseudomonas syringae]